MNEKFVFEFNVVELNIILKGLKELAYKESSDMIQGIIDSYEKQAKEKEIARKNKEAAAKANSEA